MDKLPDNINDKEELKEKYETLLKDFYELFEYAPISYLLIDDSYRIVKANLRACKMLSIPENFDISYYFNTFIDSGDLLLFEKFVQNVKKSNEIVKCELWLNDLNSSIKYYVEMSSKLYKTNNMIIALTDRTELKSLNIELNKLLTAIEQSGNVIIITSPEAKIEYVNHKFTEITGYMFNEVKGNKPNILKSGYHNDDFYKRMWDTIKKGEVWKGEFFNKKKNGEYYWEEATITPVKNEKGRITNYIAVKEDITEKKKMLEEIKRDEMQLRLLFENMASAVALHEIIFNEQGTPCDYRFLEVNKAFEEFLSLKRENVIGRKVKDIFPKLEDFWIETYARVALTGKTEKFERKFDSNGSYYSVTAYSHERGKFITIFDDITERKQMENDILKAKEKAEAANKVKNDFLANISHELRTPLNGIIGFLQLLRENNYDNETNEIIKIIELSAQNLWKLINDLLNFAKIESGQIKYIGSTFEPIKLIEEITTAFSERIKEKKLKFNIDIERNIPNKIYGDASKIKTVLYNLIDNAIKFTETGEIFLSLKNMYNNKEEIILEFLIRDTGVGIKEEKQKKLFEKFDQGEPVFKKKYGGTGVGLAISKNLTDLMNGYIYAESKEGAGSCFVFGIPCRIEKSEEKVHEDINSRKLNILLAEDNEMNQEFMRKLINKKGWNIKVAVNGMQAIEYIEKEKFDLVLMDIQMPIMNGFEATIAIRKMGNEDVKNIPIIAISAYTMDNDREMAFKCGMNDFISKPFALSHFFNTIEKWTTKKLPD